MITAATKIRSMTTKMAICFFGIKLCSNDLGNDYTARTLKRVVIPSA